MKCTLPWLVVSVLSLFSDQIAHAEEPTTPALIPIIAPESQTEAGAEHKTTVKKTIPAEHELADAELMALENAISDDVAENASIQKNGQPPSPSLLDISFILDFGAGFYSTLQKNDARPRTEDTGHNIINTSFRLQQVELAVGANALLSLRRQSCLYPRRRRDRGGIWNRDDSTWKSSNKTRTI